MLLIFFNVFRIFDDFFVQFSRVCVQFGNFGVSFTGFGGNFNRRVFLDLGLLGFRLAHFIQRFAEVVKVHVFKIVQHFCGKLISLLGALAVGDGRLYDGRLLQSLARGLRTGIAVGNDFVADGAGIQLERRQQKGFGRKDR